MKRLASGLQYHVYDTGDRVIKKPTSKTYMAFKLISWKPTKIFHPLKLKKQIKEYIRTGNKSIKEIQNKKIDLSIIGNPLFYKNKIEQDKVIPLKKLRITEELIDKYIQNIFQTWRYGFADYIFNFDVNNGLDKNNKVILLDFGELTFDKEHVKKDIQIQRWTKSASKNRLNKKMQEIYLKKMKKDLTIKNLNKYWNKNANKCK